MGFFNEIYEDLDTGTADQVTEAADIRYVSFMFVEALKTAGDTDGCVLVVECSTDKLDWNESSITLTMTNQMSMKDNIQSSFRYFRIKVKTKSVAGSTTTVCIQGK